MNRVIGAGALVRGVMRGRIDHPHLDAPESRFLHSGDEVHHDVAHRLPHIGARGLGLPRLPPGGIIEKRHARVHLRAGDRDAQLIGVEPPQGPADPRPHLIVGADLHSGLGKADDIGGERPVLHAVGEGERTRDPIGARGAVVTALPQQARLATPVLDVEPSISDERVGAPALEGVERERAQQGPPIDLGAASKGAYGQLATGPHVLQDVAVHHAVLARVREEIPQQVRQSRGAAAVIDALRRAIRAVIERKPAQAVLALVAGQALELLAEQSEQVIDDGAAEPRIRPSSHSPAPFPLKRGPHRGEPMRPDHANT